MTVRPVDVLFAISDTGGGHRSAAVAISAALDQTSGDLTWSIDDILKATDLPGVRGAPDHYDRLSTRWLRLYDLTFRLTNTTRTVDVLSRLVFMTARRNLVRVLEERHPRLVVSTHPLVHRLVVWARRSRRLPPFRVITVVTDLVSLHASWTYPGVDLALVPTDEAFAVMYRRGMRPSQMQRTGFPVHPKFVAYTASQAEARHALGLVPDGFTILLTAGGVGSGRLGELVVELEQAFPGRQLLVVTGKNRAIYDELIAGRRSAGTHVYGFVNNMEVLMAASDIVVTKAGPGTLMEALVMRRPVAVTEAVGMQEQGNIDFVLNNDLGMFCPTNERIIAAVGELQDQQRHTLMVHHLEDAVPRNGSAQIAQVIKEQLALVESRPASSRRRTGFLGLPRGGRPVPRGRRQR